MAQIAVIGAGWAGLAAAVQATSLGHTVTLYEMALQCGGRARDVTADELQLDNGQHIMIGAYSELLHVMQTVHADPRRLLLRTPLSLLNPAEQGLRLRGGHPALSFVRGVAGHPTWTWRDKLALIATCLRWHRSDFQCAAELTVAQLCAAVPRAIREDLIDPLCVAALNTPADEASARVFLRVLRDALLSGPGASDLLLPRVPLGDVFPRPAAAWLRDQGAAILVGTRVSEIAAGAGDSWLVDGTRFDGVVLATSPSEAARLANNVAPAWTGRALALDYEPIVTVYLRCPGARLAFPMLSLASRPDAPAQFVFDRGQLGGPEGLLAFVISGARPWVDRGADQIVEATVRQGADVLELPGPLALAKVLMEKRATFRCTPALQRPAGQVAAALWAAGDYIDGPYPATLEGAVRSGVDAANRVLGT